MISDIEEQTFTETLNFDDFHSNDDLSENETPKIDANLIIMLKTCFDTATELTKTICQTDRNIQTKEQVLQAFKDSISTINEITESIN